MTLAIAKIRVYILIFFAFLFYPIFTVLAFLRLRDDGRKKNPRILIIPQFTRIGDLICATPIFREIKKKYPNSYLAVVVTPKIAGIIKNNPRIDEIIIFEDRDYLEFFGLCRLFKKIRDEKFDWSICVSADTMGTILSVYGLIPNRIKIIRQERNFSEILSDWMNNFLIYYKNGEYIPQLYLKTIKFFGIESDDIKKEVFTSKVGDEKAEKFLKEKNINTNDLVIGIGATAGNKIKEWPMERFKKLAKRLTEVYKAKIIFIDPKDFSLEEFPSLMKRLNLFIAADSGPIHIAHALNVPLIDIIGPVDPADQAPQCEKCVIIKPSETIKPTIFAMRPAGDEKETRRAVESISTDMVYKAVKSLL
ncbi:MAG: glycosyltransferase family 9 protein [Patescibacteria group bacterium]